MLSPNEHLLSEARPNAVDHGAVSSLFYLGNYKRVLRTNMARMMENAHDWEHLPFVHASSFASIDLIDSGSWGWRAKIGLPGGGHQLLDLRVDSARNYWVSAIFDGPGTGVEIHTQATTLTAEEIEVDVRFYLPEAVDDPARRESLLTRLADQYRQLYDEDIALMSGRQSALDDRQRWRDGEAESGSIYVGIADDLDRDGVTIVETETGRFCVRFWKDQWIVHSAVCPHLLGPLGDSEIDASGTITCPWHGYKFDAATGENIGGQCGALAPAPKLDISEGRVLLIPLS